MPETGELVSESLATRLLTFGFLTGLSSLFREAVRFLSFGGSVVWLGEAAWAEKKIIKQKTSCSETMKG